MVTEMDEWPRWTWTALGVGTGGDEEVGAGVVEIVDPEALRDFGPLAHVAGSARPTVRVIARWRE